jgi:hypothetical protein
MEKMYTIATLWFDVPEKHEILRAQFIKEWQEVMKGQLSKNPNDTDELARTAVLGTGLWAILGFANCPGYFSYFGHNWADQSEIWEYGLKKLYEYKNGPMSDWTFMTRPFSHKEW